MRILHVVAGFQYGGAEQLILNLCRQVDRERFQFDFLTRTGNDPAQVAEIESLGGRVYTTPPIRSFGQYRKETKRFFEEHSEYRIVHFHANALIFLRPILEAKKNVCPVIIVHAHNTMTKGGFLGKWIHRYNMAKMDTVATHRIGCSSMAAEWLFGGRQATIWVNAIDTRRFQFDPVKRQEIRAAFDLSGKLVVGAVGRLAKQKNLPFLLDIFEVMAKQNPDARLLLVGDGSLRKELAEISERKGLSHLVLMPGNSPDIPAFLSALDCYIMPSLFEGISLSLLEAQASGLPCLVSDTISPDGIVLPGLKQLSLQDSPAKWAELAFALCKSTDRLQDGRQMQTSKFDIQVLTRTAEDFYAQCSTMDTGP